MKPYSLLFLGGWGISLLVSCTAEEDALYAEDAAQGRIVLSMPQLEPFLEVRAEQTLTDFSGYTFTLKGTNSDGWTVNETLQLQKEGKQYSCIIPAGNYTLTADNATAAVAGNGGKGARLILDVVPLDAVALLGVGAVLLHAKALAVELQLHLLGVGVGIERKLFALLPVPVL